MYTFVCMFYVPSTFFSKILYMNLALCADAYVKMHVYVFALYVRLLVCVCVCVCVCVFV